MTNRYRTLTIRTAEGIVFSQALAGPVPRMLAWSIDFVCMMAILYLFTSLFNILALFSPGFMGALSLLLYFVISMGYGMTLEWYWRGQTIGKRLLRLRVIDVQGLRLQPSQVIVRNLLRVVDMLPACYFIGGLSCLFNRYSQRLGDLAANTVVVRLPQLKEPNLENLLAGKFNSFRDYPHLEARLRQTVSPHEAGLALQALVRRDLLDPAARIQLFTELADHFRAKVKFPSEATDGLADEQYIRNVVDVLYRKRTGESTLEKPSEPAPEPAAHAS